MIKIITNGTNTNENDSNVYHIIRIFFCILILSGPVQIVVSRSPKSFRKRVYSLRRLRTNLGLWVLIELKIFFFKRVQRVLCVLHQRRDSLS